MAEYGEEYDGQGRLWEIPHWRGTFASQLGINSIQKSRKLKNLIQLSLTYAYNWFEVNNGSKTTKDPSTIENHILLSEFASQKDLENLIESRGSIIYFNKAINYYKEEVSGTDKFDQFKNKTILWTKLL